MGFKVMNSLYRKQTRNKTLLPSSKKGIRNNKKNKTVFVVDTNYHVKRPHILRSNLGKYTETNSSRN